MATRNLTKKFVDIRNGAKANRGLGVTSRGDSFDEGQLLQGNTDSANYKAAKQALPPVWVEKIEQVEEDISKIQLKIRELSSLHTKRLMVNFETDEAQQEREIDNKTREITEVFHHAEGLLKRFGKQSEDPNIPEAERKVRKNMQMAIAKKLQGLSMSFRSTQKQYMNRLKGQKDGSGAQAFGFLEETSKKSNQSQEIVDTGFSASQMQELEETEDLINERDAEIVKIAKSIEELAAIFKELAVLVIDQGTILDRIDYNMESAVEQAKEGIKQLEKAEEHQKNSMSVKCIIALVVLIIIMVGVLIWKHSKK